MANFTPRYSAKEQQAYHNKMSKKGAVRYSPTTGQPIQLSDFERGVHHGKAQSILAARRAKAKRAQNN